MEKKHFRPSINNHHHHPSCSNLLPPTIIGGMPLCAVPTGRAFPICSAGDTIVKVSSRQPLTTLLDEDEMEDGTSASSSSSSSSSLSAVAAAADKHYHQQQKQQASPKKGQPAAFSWRLAISWRRPLLATLWRQRRFALIWLTPVLLAPLLHSGEQEYKCAFCAILMAVYWTCEVMPVGITALLPTVLFPALGILSARDVSHEFLNDTNFLFIGGLVVAAAVEKCGLHERVALRVMSLVGSEPRCVMLGFMLITAALSMFISNTATCAMMLPIGQSVILQFCANSATTKSAEEGKLGRNRNSKNNDDGTAVLKQICSNNDANARMAKALVLSIAFGANIGGVGTPTGTSSNLVLVGMLSTLFPDADTGVNYMSWMALTVPLMCCCLLTCWALLSMIFLRNSAKLLGSNHRYVAQMMHRRANRLPPMSYAQKSVSGCFLLLLLLWVGREPGFMPGIGALFPSDFYTDSTSAMAVAILLFLLPAENPLISCSNGGTTRNGGTTNSKDNDANSNDGDGTTGESDHTRNNDEGMETTSSSSKRLMDWPTMQKQFPWGVVLLLGGGFALAAGVKESGLSKLMANALGKLDDQPGWILQLICTVVIMLVTNICSNAVTASIFIPIVASMAQRAQLHPLALMLPTTLACSFAFVLPVGTPPNALAIGSGLLRVSDLMLSGLAVSAASALLTIAYLSKIAPLILPIDRFPAWAAASNGTKLAAAAAVAAASDARQIVTLGTLIEDDLAPQASF